MTRFAGIVVLALAVATALPAQLRAAAQDAAAPAPAESELERCLRLAREGSPVVRPQAAKRLAGMGEPAAEAVLAAGGDTTAGLAKLGVDLVEVLGELPSEKLRTALWKALMDRDFPWRPSAARSLAKTAQKDEAELFVLLTEDHLAAVRDAALVGLEVVDARGHEDVVESLLSDPSDRVRRQAALLLDRWGDPCALYYVVEDLRRVDRFFDLDTGKTARYEAAKALTQRFGEGFGYAPESTDSEASRAAVARFEESIAALCKSGQRPALPDIARAGPPSEGEAFGLEIRSCRRGEFFLRWTADDRLLVGTGNPLALKLAEETTQRLAETAHALLEDLGVERFFGRPGCDSEAFYIAVAQDEPLSVVRVSKGPDPAADLRPAALQAWARALVATLPEDNELAPGLREHIAEALASVGGAVD